MSARLQMPRIAHSFLAHPLRLAVIGLAGASLLLAACDDTSAAGDDATASPTPTATSEGLPANDGDSGGAAGGAAGGGIEPANPEAPPKGDLNASSGSVPLGLGTYCWSPPTGSGKPAMCADAIGIITATEDLVVTAGEDLTVTGDESNELTLPPMAIAYAYLYDAPDAPIAEGDDFRGWTPSAGERALEFGDDVISLPEDLAPGRYLLAVNYSAGPDRGSEATYGALLVVE